MRDQQENFVHSAFKNLCEFRSDRISSYCTDGLMIAGGVALVLSRGKLSAAAEKLLPKATDLLEDMHLLDKVPTVAAKWTEGLNKPGVSLSAAENIGVLSRRERSRPLKGSSATLETFLPTLWRSDGTVAKAFYEQMNTPAWKNTNGPLELTDSRLPILQAAGDRLADTHGLPRPKFHLIDEPGTLGVYIFGTERIGISRTKLASGSIGNIAGTAAHEMTHLEQAHLVISKIADDLSIGKTASRQELQSIGASFERQFDLKPNFSFIEKSLEKRAGVELSAYDREHALMVSRSVVSGYARKKDEHEANVEYAVLNDLADHIVYGSDQSKMDALKRFKAAADVKDVYSAEGFTLNQNPSLRRIVRSLKVDHVGEFVPLDRASSQRLEHKIFKLADKKMTALTRKMDELEEAYYAAPHEEEAQAVSRQIEKQFARWEN